MGDIKNITSKWLKDNGISALIVSGFISKFWFRIRSIFVNYKSVVIEKGNPYISDTRYLNSFRRKILNRNRFQASKLTGFRFFIEDMPENAIKLSSLCDYVFLFDEPYNKDERYNFPKNVIRVESWEDIYRYMKTLG